MLKKNYLFVLYLLLVTCYLLPAQSGIIREFIGLVEVKPAGASYFMPAQRGMEITKDTLVSTGLRSTALIKVGSTTITVRSLTRLSLAEIHTAAQEEKVDVKIQTGRVRVDVKPPAGTRAAVSVRTPSSSSSVRGTSFEVDALNLTVIEGKVIYEGNNGFAVPVFAGGASIINFDGMAVNPVFVAESELMPASPVDNNITGEMASNLGSDHSELDVNIGFE